jgi:hypothetical protein
MPPVCTLSPPPQSAPGTAPFSSRLGRVSLPQLHLALPSNNSDSLLRPEG